MYDILKKLYEANREKEYIFPSIGILPGTIEYLDESRITIVITDEVNGKKYRIATHPNNVIVTEGIEE
jgi:hypothetical protein